MVMTMYKSPVLDIIRSHGATHNHATEPANQHWIMGILLLLGSCCGWAGYFILQAFPGFKSDINDMIQSAEFRRGFELLDLDGGIERDLYINGMIQSATKKVQKQHWLILISVGKVC